MLPDLFSIGPLTVHGYGLMIAIGVLAAITLGEYRCKKIGLAEDGFMTNLGISVVIGGFASAKILFWITILPEIIKNPSIMKDFSNGFVVFGGLIGGVMTAIVFSKMKGKNFLEVFDLTMPLVALAQGFGRIGCLLAGCCYGREAKSGIGIIFHHSPFAPNDVALIPTQLISAGLDFVNFLLLSYLWKKKKKTGTVGACYVITYSVGRFMLEFLRGDLERGSVGRFSTSQFIAIFTLIIGVVLCIVTNSRRDKAED